MKISPFGSAPYATTYSLDFRVRSRWTISRMASPAALISVAVVGLPNENRTADRARSTGKPIASKTCDARTDPTMQAEPLDAHTPFRSSAINMVSESSPTKLTFSVFDNRGAVPPFRQTSGNASAIRVHRSSRNFNLPFLFRDAIAQHPFGCRRHSGDRRERFLFRAGADFRASRRTGSAE